MHRLTKTRERARGDLAAAFEVFLSHVEAAGNDLSLREWLELAEAWRIRLALRLAQGNRSAAARGLGIGRRTLYAKMHKLRL
jgi:transcriptional regulator with PAS, ATPase and Fis domain